MKFIKRKNLYEGEDLLYIPGLHWMYVVEPLFKAVIVLIPLAALYYAGAGLLEAGAAFIIKKAFLAAILGILAVLVWRIFSYLNTEYGITNKRLLRKKGVFRITAMDLPTDRIESIVCRQGILGRIFHYGTILITGIGGVTRVFDMVCKPYAVRRKIISIVEKNKAITVIHGEPPKPSVPMPPPEPVEEEEPLYRYGIFVRVMNGHRP
jgi:membrane protein YdbS with pleckstrin-like domain